MKIIKGRISFELIRIVKDKIFVSANIKDKNNLLLMTSPIYELYEGDTIEIQGMEISIETKLTTS